MDQYTNFYPVADFMINLKCLHKSTFILQIHSFFMNGKICQHHVSSAKIVANISWLKLLKNKERKKQGTLCIISEIPLRLFYMSTIKNSKQLDTTTRRCNVGRHFIALSPFCCADNLKSAGRGGAETESCPYNNAVSR